MLCLIQALTFALHKVRLSHHAPWFESLTLARMKETVRLLCSSIVLLGAVAVSPAQAHVVWQYIRGCAATPSAAAAEIGLCAFIGVVATGAASWAQTAAQSSVKASTAQVIFSHAALWSALFAFILFGETFGLMDSAGALLIIFGVLLEATGNGALSSPTH